MTKIVVVGSINMDLVVRGPHIPIPGETVLGSDFGTYPGGKGANQAVAAVRQGVDVTMIGCVGDDLFGRQLVSGLQAGGIDTIYIELDKTAPTGVALITLAASGQNSIVVTSGANYKLTPAHIHQASPAFSNASALLLQLESPLDTVLAAAQKARDLGVQVILNPAPARALSQELLSLVDVLIPNESEASKLTGLSVASLEQAETAARVLLDMGTRCVVITLGAQGALLVRPGLPPIYSPAFPVEVVDTTSAGDSFIGAFSVSLAEGLPVEIALRRGCAAGALAATRRGAQPSIPTRSEIDRFLAGQG